MFSPVPGSDAGARVSPTLVDPIPTAVRGNRGMQLYNTMSRQKETLTATDNRIGMYVCGVTPYDTTHVGHAFTFLTFDILARYLRSLDYQVTYVQNVTDIDDDILRKAKQVGLSWDELGRRETEKYLSDMRNLDAATWDHYLRATEHVPEMVAIIEKLIAAGKAYESGGSVYFDVSSDPEFGKLSQIPSSEQLAVANERGNVADDPKKRAPIDFILWQAASPGEPTWESPWGPGRPGWHIECSAMASKYLGWTIDIHGGGGDLVFPHHECEIAQSENASGESPFVRFWMHVGMVRYQGEKMSKSLGNLVLVSDVLQTYNADTLRLYLFSHHYRESWEYKDDEVDEWARVADDLAEAANFPAFGIEEEVDVSVYRERFFNAMDDDLDTPHAIDALIEISRAILEAPEDDDIREAQATLRELSSILGLSLSE